MNVKAHGLLNGAKWIEEQYGRDGLRDVIRACSEPVRDRYTTAIAITWHPLEEFVEFVTVADRVLGRGDGKVAEELGAAGARVSTKSMLLRIVFYVTKPEIFMQRVATLWRQYNDEGAMDAPVVEDHNIVLRLSGISPLPRIFCHVLAGWIREMGRASGAIDATARISEHVENGAGAHCLWEMRWTKEGADDGGGPVSSRTSKVLPKVPSKPPR